MVLPSRVDICLLLTRSAAPFNCPASIIFANPRHSRTKQWPRPQGRKTPMRCRTRLGRTVARVHLKRPRARSKWHRGSRPGSPSPRTTLVRGRSKNARVVAGVHHPLQSMPPPPPRRRRNGPMRGLMMIQATTNIGDLVKSIRSCQRWVCQVAQCEFCPRYTCFL